MCVCVCVCVIYRARELMVKEVTEMYSQRYKYNVENYKDGLTIINNENIAD